METRLFVIAEAGVNHCGSVKLAKDMIRVARESGADAIKFQAFRAEELAHPQAPTAAYQSRGGGQEKSQFEMLKDLELNRSAFSELIEESERQGIEFMSTPFSESCAQMLEDLGVHRFKIGSGEITNPRLIRCVASLGKPVILSTGMSTLDEVRRAVGWIREREAPPPLSLLHCVSAYPAEPRDMNLRCIPTLASEFQVPVGLSDHTLGFDVALAAVALGATIVEKHFTLDRNAPGPDHQASLEPSELNSFIHALRGVEAGLGDGVKRPVESERDTLRVARRSIVAACDLAAGTVLADAHLKFLRPGTGISPADIDRCIGRRLQVDLPAGDQLAWSMIQ